MARHDQSFKKWFYGASLNTLYTNGKYSYRYNNGTVHEGADDYWLERDNNRVTSCGVAGYGGITTGRVKYTLSNNYTFNDRGLAGTAGNETRKVNMVTHRNMLNLNIAADGLLEKRLKLGGDLYYSLKRDFYRDPLNELGLGTAKQEGIYDSFGMNFQGSYLFFKPVQEASLSINTSGDLYRAATEGLGENPRQGRYNFDAALEDIFSFYDDRIRLSLQGRFLLWHDSFAEENPVTGDVLPREETTDYAFTWQGEFVVT